jgi:hypothetical protein
MYGEDGAMREFRFPDVRNVVDANPPHYLRVMCEIGMSRTEFRGQFSPLAEIAVSTTLDGTSWLPTSS